jgi:hypothetical protein
MKKLALYIQSHVRISPELALVTQHVPCLDRPEGSLKVLTTVEKSKFQKGDDGVWALIESEFVQ